MDAFNYDEPCLMHCEGCDEYYIYDQGCNTCEKRRIADTGENDDLLFEEEPTTMTKSRFLHKMQELFVEYWPVEGIIGWDIIDNCCIITSKIPSSELLLNFSVAMKPYIAHGLLAGYVRIDEISLEDKIRRLEIDTTQR